MSQIRIWRFGDDVFGPRARAIHLYFWIQYIFKPLVVRYFLWLNLAIQLMIFGSEHVLDKNVTFRRRSVRPLVQTLNINLMYFLWVMIQLMIFCSEYVLNKNLTFRRRRVQTKAQDDPFVFLGSMCVQTINLDLKYQSYVLFMVRPCDPAHDIWL